MSDRYYCPAPEAAERVTLEGPEAHHLIHVMRARAGDEVVLFDGEGHELRAQIERLTRRDAELAILDRKLVDRELPFDLTLATALPKGDRQRWLVEKAVELGVTRLVPLVTERSVAMPGPKALERLWRTVIEASKQCGRNRLMRIGPGQKWADWVRHVPASVCRWVAHPGTGKGVRNLLCEAPSGPFRQKVPDPFSCPAGPDFREATSSASSVMLAIGPEGGLTEDEVALASDAGWHAIDLGPRILRIETAAVYLTALVLGSRASIADSP